MPDSILPLFVCGPTASGKSSLAILLAEAWQGEIVNADAFQLYRGLETITASPSVEDLSRVPHHLYGVLDPQELCDAMRFRSLALPVIEEIQSRGVRPIIAGGSGLYLKFLSHGPSPLPSGDPVLRAQLDELSHHELLARLDELDPEEGRTIDRYNRRYVTRAVEICLLSGSPVSGLRRDWDLKSAETQSHLQGIFIQRTRPDLHARIARRTAMMLKGDAPQEVQRYPVVSSTLEKAIGYREVLEWMNGTLDRATCEAQINAATRQYAKRQETWFRREPWLKPVHELTVEAVIHALSL